MMQLSTVGARAKLGLSWRRSGNALPSAVWIFIPRRPGSSTARMPLAGNVMKMWRSISWATHSNHDGRENRQGKNFVSFLPAISAKAAKGIRQTVRAWRIASTRNNQRLEDLAKLIDPVVRGWMNYYGRYYRTKCIAVLHHINAALARWARRKYKRLRYGKTASVHWLGGLARRDPNLLYLCQIGIRPAAGR